MTYMPKELQKVVGTRPIRPDGVDKVTGKANFGADMVMPGMLWGKVKRSPYPHARIVSYDTEAASARPGVIAIVTGEDLRDLVNPIPNPHSAKRNDWPITRRITFTGDAPSAMRMPISFVRWLTR